MNHTNGTTHNRPQKPQQRKGPDIIERTNYQIKKVCEEKFGVKEPIIVMERHAFRHYEAYVDEYEETVGSGIGENVLTSVRDLLSKVKSYRPKQ